MVKGIDNELIYFIVSHHINHFLNVKKMTKHDYESHMILLTVYSHYLYQTITLGKSLSWTEVFDETETEDHKILMKDKKLTIFAVAALDGDGCASGADEMQAAPPTTTITIQGQ